MDPGLSKRKDRDTRGQDRTSHRGLSPFDPALSRSTLKMISLFG